MNRPGLSGIALGLVTGGIVLTYSGLKNATVLDTVRALLRGEPVTSGPSQIDAARQAVAATTAPSGRVLGYGNALGQAVADRARFYVGKVPYVWAGEDPSGWDCSGFVTYLLHHDFGLELPDNTHTVTAQFMTWSGAATIPRDQCEAGDLVCWWPHIGLATGRDTMVNAAAPGTITREERIWGDLPPVIRRPYAYASAPPALARGD